MQKEALDFVQQLLEKHGKDQSTIPSLGFRKRSSHIRRVCMWLERLLVQGGVENVEALRLAAAFHDVGYVYGGENHAQNGVELLMNYAGEQGIHKETAERAAFLVAEHSNKDKWLQSQDGPMDLILLMEADLLDEEGAMGIALDCMSAAALGLGYEAAYERMQRYEPPRLAANRMVTPLAQQFWAEKQDIIRSFVQAYAYDLGMESGV